jgi:putative inorganic carbon (hco3(-)) transporter
MERVELAQAAAIVGAVAAPLLLAAWGRLAFAAGLAGLLAAEIGLAFALVPDQISAFTSSAPQIAASLAGLLALGALAALFARFPEIVPAALLTVSAVRIPLDVRGEEAFLLVPLYGVLAASALALAFRLSRGAALRPLPRFLSLPAGAYVAVAGISLLWSDDPREGSIELFFFLFPCAVLVAVLAQADFTRFVGRSLAAALVATCTIAAAIGISQQWTHALFFADDLQTSNAFTSYYRVSSFFSDPSVYGRYLALGILVLFVLLWLGRLRPALGLPVLAVLSAGLYFSYSQSSFVALFAGVLVVMLVAGDRRVRLATAIAAAAVVLVGAGLVTAAVRGDSVREATSGRWGLASRTLPVFRDHPVAGVGLGAQPLASSKVEGARRRETKNVSHTTPLTVAAELGVLGLAAYVAFLVGAARGSLLALRKEPAVGLSLLGALVLLTVHSLAYSGFFEDPFIWFVVGLAAACLTTRRDE